MAKEAVGGQSDEVPHRVRWQTSLPQLARRAAEGGTAATTQLIRDHVLPERGYHPPGAAALGRERGDEHERPRPSVTTGCCQATQRSDRGQSRTQVLHEAPGRRMKLRRRTNHGDLPMSKMLNRDLAPHRVINWSSNRYLSKLLDRYSFFLAFFMYGNRDAGMAAW